MSRKGGDWVPCSDYGQTLSIAGPLVTIEVVLVAPRDVSLPTGASIPSADVGVIEVENDIISNRVVGQVLVSSDGPSVYIERIRLGILDNNGARAFYANDFTSSEDANEPFLWQRVNQMPVADFNVQILAHPYWSVIDCRVSRRIKPGMALFYSLQQLSPVTTLRVVPYLRTWARVT